MIHRWFRPRIDQRSETIWLTIYADLVTNLALVFLALYGLTIMGQEAIVKAIQSMKLTNESFQGADLNFESLGPILHQKFENNPDIGISEETGAIRILFGEKVLFESGRAVPKASSREVLKTVADLLKSMPRTIVVEGHTDSVPLQAGGLYRDNWELSLARAMSIVDLLIKEGGISPDHVAAAAYGSYRPRSTNMTSSGRRVNRRVEIALFKDFPYEIKHSEQIQPGLQP